MTPPLVSICIPTFNGSRFLRETLESVLSQTHENLEIIVSDHSSTDNTREVLNSFADPRITYKSLPSGGGAASNWNSAISTVAGEYAMLLCQDDRIKPNCIERHVEALELNPNASFSFSSRDVISPRGRRLLRSRGFKTKLSLLKFEEHIRSVIQSGTNVFGEPCCVLMRSKSLRSTTGFVGSYLIDLNMWIELWKIAPAVVIPESLAQFRISADSWTTALTNQQSSQISQKFDELMGEYPEIITLNDVLRGKSRSKRLEKSRFKVMKIAELFRL